MNKIDNEILNIDAVICKNIEKFDASERGILSQNILSQLRNFLEHIALKEYANGKEIDITYENLKNASKRLPPKGSLSFLRKFHNFLQGVASHYTPGEENSERLMLKYYEYLLRIKYYLKSTYDLEVLSNIDKFPINTDSALKEYYEKIVEKINHPTATRKVSPYSDRYYIRKIKPFFVGHEIFYEVTFTIASAEVSKFDRVIAFTKLDISANYAVKLSVIHDSIEVLGKKMPIQIIDKWEVSIRPCELNNFAHILGKTIKIQTTNLEYKNLMKFLTETSLSLVEVINLSDDYYDIVKDQVTQGVQTINFFDVLDKSRTLINNNASGSNMIRYLLHALNNKIIKLQRSYYGGYKLQQNLNLDIGCKPFDDMPFNSSPKGHNPKISDVFECINSIDREHELFARLIWSNTENKSQLYTPLEEIPQSQEEVDKLMTSYNSRLYYKHEHRILKKFKDHIYIDGYEKDTVDIIKKLKEISSGGISNYSNSVKSWVKLTDRGIDSPEKKEILIKMFEDSKVAIIYGAAGTGKTRLIEHVSDFFNDNKKLYLAKTNPAVENLRRRVGERNVNDTFQTIDKFLSRRNTNINFDLLIIDECSTVSNSDMVKILNKGNFKSMILVGDVFQIESITFGNWFDVVRSLISKTSVFELTIPHRTSDPKLIELWSRVRNFEDNILEQITKYGYTANLNKSIFDNLVEDEIILCLNYDGLYGINNLNKFLQSNNKNISVDWGIQIYKIGDPILFNETDRFTPIIYNNLKGRIINIERFVNKIRFSVEIDRVINELQASGHDFELVGSAVNGNSIISFFVNGQGNTDDDEELSDSIMPFQVAYAVSIHKAQGLEYNSVKVVITNETEEMITHNIFYTAITRAKEKLKIYWTPETEKKILSSFNKTDNQKDIVLLSSKFSL